MYIFTQRNIIRQINQKCECLSRILGDHPRKSVYHACEVCVSKASHHLGYERVCLPLCEVADAPFHIHGNELTVTYPSHVRLRSIKSHPYLLMLHFQAWPKNPNEIRPPNNKNTVQSLSY